MFVIQVISLLGLNSVIIRFKQLIPVMFAPPPTVGGRPGPPGFGPPPYQISGGGAAPTRNLSWVLSLGKNVEKNFRPFVRAMFQTASLSSSTKITIHKYTFNKKTGGQNFFRAARAIGIDNGSVRTEPSWLKRQN